MSNILNYDLASRLYQMNNPYIATDLFYANFDIGQFMALKKEEYLSDTTVSQNSSGTPGASKMDEMLGESGKQIIKVAENLAAKKIIQTYYDQYMSPLSSDIIYRLGTVSGVKATNISDVVTSGVSTAEYSTDNLILDSGGRIFTRCNFVKQFPVSLYSAKRNTDVNYSVPYINQFFPPYQRTGNIRQANKDFYKHLNAWKAASSSDAAAIPTMDLNTFKCSRGNFTYRDPGFKSINDNIQFLQYLLEQCTGIVSTYLTEWDLSIYMQEGILPTTDENPTGNPIIYLLQGVRFDNPLADKSRHYYYGSEDDRPLGFAAVNAAVSKLNGDCEKTWVPNYYPLSCYWSPYWDYNDFVSKKAHRDGQVCYISDGETTVIAPDFYSTNGQAAWTNIDANARTFKDKVTLVDKRNAALSCWTSWDGLCYYNLFYSTPDDGLSTTDTLIQSLDKKSFSLKKVMKSLRENLISMGGSYGAPLSAGSTGTNQQIPATSTDGSSMSQDQISSTSSSSGGGNIKSDFIKWLLGKKSKPSDPDTSSYTSGSGSASSSDDADDSGLTSHDSNGCSSASDALDKFVASGKSKKIATNATTTGIPQHNPPLFGGPHGKYSSPRTPQSYFEYDNKFLRNIPRIDGNMHNNFTDMNSNNYYTGAEQYARPENSDGSFYADSKYNMFYTSPSLTMHQMQEGTWQWIWDYSTYTYSVYQYFQGEIRTTYSACSTYIYFPSYYNGSYIYYTDSSVHWMTARHYMPYSSRTSWYEGAYWSYLNENSYSRVVYFGNRPYWYVESYGPHKYGYIRQTVVSWFKKFLLHNEPNVRWTITRLPFNNWGIYHNCLGDDGNFIRRLGIGLGKWYSKSLAYYPTYRYHDHGSRYKLDIWDGYKQWGDTFAAGYWWRSSEADRAENRLVKNNRSWGSTIKLIFCEGTYQSRWSRFYNGPSSMFRCDVRMGWYWGLYWYPHYKCRCGRRKFCHWIPKWRPVSFVEVLPETVTDIYEQTDRDPYSTINEEPYYFFDQPHNWKDVYGKGPFEHMSPWGGGSSCTTWWGHYIWSSVGMRGWGILSNICGLNSTNISSPSFLKGNQTYEYLQNLSGPTNINTLKSQRIKDIKHYYPYISYYAAPYVRDNYGSNSYLPGGNPHYELGVLDRGLSRAITRIWTRSVVCKDDDRMYYASLDNGFRLLLQQLKWQISFLETARQMFVTDIDFNVVRNLLKNFVDPSVYNASSPYNYTDSKGLFPYDKSFYSYWIAQARSLFEGTNTDTASLKRRIDTAFSNRIKVLSNAEAVLKPVASKRAEECSWNELTAAWSQIPVIHNQLNNNTIEEYIMSYLEILYQYRKYFINMRFNKQDGTMWMMRELEGILDNALSAAIKVDMPSISTLAPEKSSSKIPVKFYHITNSTAEKVAAIVNKTYLNEDCIKTVFVKVDYVTKDDYDEEQKQLAIDGKASTDGLIVYIEENGKYAKKPVDGLYHLESQEYINAKMNEQYNIYIANHSTSPDQEVYFPSASVDYTSKYIYWGNREDLTPIKFNVVTGMDITGVTDALKSGAELTGLEQYCSSRDENDFWTVHLVTYPRASGYKTNVKLVKSIDKDGILSTSDGPEQTINGAFAYSLWPVTEDQADILPDDLSSALLPAEMKEQIANKKLTDLS